jgi:isoleucyl-tRNA synthetase
VSILPEEITVETEAREGFHVETDNGRSVALDTVMTDDLKMEGFARELVNKIQATRKEAGFEISDRICTVCAGGPESMRALAEHTEYLMGETLSLSLVQGEPEGEYVKEWDVNGEKVTVGVRRVR